MFDLDQSIGSAVAITDTELESLRESSRVVVEQQVLTGPLRILESADHGGFLLQEHSADGTPVVRRLASLDEALRFVSRRLDQYDRMWDGCGHCSIDYFAPPESRSR